MRLWAVTPDVADLRDGLRDRCRDLVAEGVDTIFFREKSLDDAAFERLAKEITFDLSPFGATVVVAEREHLVVQIGAHAIQRSFRNPQQKKSGVDYLIGRSIHDPEDLAAAVAEDVDYVVLGPVHDTPSKRGLKAPLGWSKFADLSSRAGRPVFAIGGIEPRDVADALRSGAHGVVAMRSFFFDLDWRSRPSEFRRSFIVDR
jgi:thiamine-phosphate diphosphorylase